MHTIDVQTVGLSLLSYSSPTDAKPTGSVIVEVLYDNIDYTDGLIVVFSSIGSMIFIAIVCLVSAFVLTLCSYHVCTINHIGVVVIKPCGAPSPSVTVKILYTIVLTDFLLSCIFTVVI